ncbi:hypothetical protein T10_2815 [Trichinella papuae]|uniref:Uncharacterized protein n=1 Tax=Trichinella papuae TaxID=268474 RepID=A0A0V1M4J3_9BILA|nr:hypothetical protein T10_2815 [Trichinella papuae]
MPSGDRHFPALAIGTCRHLCLPHAKPLVQVHLLDVCLQPDPVPPEANEDSQQISLKIRSRFQPVVQGDSSTLRRSVEDDAELHVTRAPLLVHGVMRQSSPVLHQPPLHRTKLLDDEHIAVQQSAAGLLPKKANGVLPTAIREGPLEVLSHLVDLRFLWFRVDPNRFQLPELPQDLVCRLVRADCGQLRSCHPTETIDVFKT